jgi:peptidoglycan hydrolase-like protein with peptidoglycan-binding domain
MARSQVQYGSQGVDVKELQKILNKSGYNLAEDGIFGTKTQAAVKDYQQKSGLSVDGIVGTNTWGSLLGGTASTAPITPPKASTPTAAPTASAPIAAPTVSPLPTAPQYDDTKWGDTTEGKNAWNAYQDAINAVNNHGNFQYANQAQLDAIMNSILNREKFSYNFNEDAFYQQYKDKYMKQGKMASADVMGQAAAMTGGYGSSYAATAGNQAYQASLEKLNDVIPELYQMAYDQYNQEGQDLYNKYGLLESDYQRAYGEHNDQYNKLMDALGIARDDYYDGANMFHTEQSNQNSLKGQAFNDAMSIWQSESDQAWKNAEWDESNRRYNDDIAWKNAEWDESLRQRAEDIAYRDYRDQVEDQRYADEFAYQKERDLVADSQWQQQYDAQYGNTAVDNNTKLYNGTNNDGVNYNNGSLTTSQIKELQAALGVNADGYYGPKSKEAAGGLSAAEAYAKYVGGEITNKSSVPESVVSKVKGYTTEKGQADYLANEVNKGTITEDQAIEILNNHGVTDLVNRTWEVVDDGGINWFGIGIDADAKVSDGTKTYTLAQLRKELQKTMSYKEATDWIKKKFKV